MGLNNYASASRNLATELIQLLSEAEITTLFSELKESGEKAWIKWQLDNSETVIDFVAATALQRSRKKAWNNPSLRGKLILASIIHCQAAYELLNFLTQNEPWLRPGCGYREMASRAGDLYWGLLETDVPNWPSDLGDSPFEPTA